MGERPPLKSWCAWSEGCADAHEGGCDVHNALSRLEAALEEARGEVARLRTGSRYEVVEAEFRKLEGKIASITADRDRLRRVLHLIENIAIMTVPGYRSPSLAAVFQLAKDGLYPALIASTDDDHQNDSSTDGNPREGGRP